jgi:hypothetical protein
VLIQIWEAIILYYRELRFKEIIVKLIPYIYPTVPCDEMRFALFKTNAINYRQDVSSTVSLNSPISFSKGRKWLLTRSRKSNFTLVESLDFVFFFEKLNEILFSKYGVNAVHTAEEMKKLAHSFPNNIKLFLVSNS